MSNQILQAQQNIITDEMNAVAIHENLDPQVVRQKILEGRAVIISNNQKENDLLLGVGEGLRTKVASNIMHISDINVLFDKIRVINQTGADIVIDSSINESFDLARQGVILNSKLPVATCPMYQSFKEVLDETGDVKELTKEKIFSDIEKHCADGVDMLILHCGITKNALNMLSNQQRLFDIGSLGGIMTAGYIKAVEIENPLCEYFDELIEILKYYDVTLCLASALKSYSVIDANDRVQHYEIITLGDLAKRARRYGVQTIIEGVGHVPLNMISSIVQTTKELTDYIPLFASDMSVCDCAVGYENLTSAMTGAFAAYNGANMLSCPSVFVQNDNMRTAKIREGIMFAKVAAHCADLSLGNKETVDKNIKMAIARANFDAERQKQNALDDDAIEKLNFNNEHQKIAKELLKKYFN